MRILQILGTSTGGVGTHVRALARDLAKTHTVAVLAPASTLSHFDLDQVPNVTAIACAMSTQLHPRDVTSIRELRRRIHHFAPDIIHAHGFRAGLLSLLAARRSPVPVVVSWHNQASGRGIKQRLEHAVESFIARRADLTLGASEDLAERARAVGGTRVDFAPVAAPAPAAVTPAESEGLRRELLDGFPGNAMLALMVGRVAPQKNYELLIDVAERLTDLPLHIVIAGAADAGVQTELTDRLARTDLGAARVSFLGPRSDVSALMSAADCYLLTSHWEARALVVQEALAAGLPIIASKVGGIPELVAGAGILVDPASPAAADEFASAIRELSDPAGRREWSARARARAAELPDEEAVARNLERHYTELLSS